MKYTKEEKPLTREDKLRISKRGKDVGKIGMLSGGMTMAGSIIPDAMSGLKTGSKFIEEAGGKMAAKKMRAGGAILAGTSGALYGYSAYKHHKLKKEEEQEKNDNPKK